MRWKNSRQSSNIEDRRGDSPTQAGPPIAGLLRLVPLLMRSKIGRIILVVGGLFFAYQYFTGGGTSLGIQQSHTPTKAPLQLNDENKQFVAAILGSTESVWDKQLAGKYQPPTLVLYNDITRIIVVAQDQLSRDLFIAPQIKKSILIWALLTN